MFRAAAGSMRSLVQEIDWHLPYCVGQRALDSLKGPTAVRVLSNERFAQLRNWSAGASERNFEKVQEGPNTHCQDSVPHHNEEILQSLRNSAGTSGRQTTVYHLDDQRTLKAGVMGAPNAGKSTLVNRLVGSKVSAVSDKTNTTSTAMLGAFTEGPSQILLYDLPGIVAERQIARYATYPNTINSPRKAMQDYNLAMFVIDASRQVARPDPRVVRAVEELEEHTGNMPLADTILILNKMDNFRGPAERAVDNLERQLTSITQFGKVFRVSAISGQGVPELREFLISRSSPQPWLLDPDQTTDLPNVDLACEVVREKLFKKLHHELPYKTKLTNTYYEKKADGSLRIVIDILAPSEVVRRMIIGRQGAVVGEIGMVARKELGHIFNTKVHLFLNVPRV